MLWVTASLSATAQQPIVEDISSRSGSFYEQTQTQPSSGGALVLFNQVQEHQREIQQLRGQLEELRHEFERQMRQSQQRYIDLEDRIVSLEKRERPAAPENEPEAASTVSEESITPEDEEPLAAVTEEGSHQSINADVQQAYQEAFSHVQARRFDDAIAAFQDFVDQYADSSLTPNGYYWLGELYAAKDELVPAEEAFDRVINEFSDSRKVPDALYKLGLLKARLGESERSRELLTQVRDDYPQSSAAGLASDFLRQSAN
ncbi:tol-pal system protein YbgF [Halomonas vilamensis]|uniref:Cell division coordinator CpoB n=1 Tax=Vreelandella vilamensis TaxID=531309 RepID=A0ABU1H3M1_9GAMM|nr:tol-pal system protein YbgF [Halomonas vilamensis]